MEKREKNEIGGPRNTEDYYLLMVVSFQTKALVPLELTCGCWCHGWCSRTSITRKLTIDQHVIWIDLTFSLIGPSSTALVVVNASGLIC